MNKTILWAKGLAAAVISGAAHSAGAVLGIGAANMVGANIKPLDLKELGVVAATGAVTGCVAYLMKSPMPTGDGPSAA
jgi:hypothetical protein